MISVGCSTTVRNPGPCEDGESSSASCGGGRHIHVHHFEDVAVRVGEAVPVHRPVLLYRQPGLAARVPLAAGQPAVGPELRQMGFPSAPCREADSPPPADAYGLGTLVEHRVDVLTQWGGEVGIVLGCSGE